jgi:methionine sulfoxide reductase heme-binding subunit
MSAARPALARRPRGRFEGPSLVAWVAAALALLVAVLLVGEGTGEAGLRAVVRWTARTGLAFFLAAYAASSLRRLWPRTSTAWLVRNRRWLGLSFATAQAVHLAAIGLLARHLGPSFEIEPVSFAGGTLGYVFTAALAATSSDRAVAWLGPARWRLLHRVGIHWLWIVFAVTEIPAAALSPLHLLLAALVVGAAILRLVAWRVGRRARLPASAVADRMR